MKKKDNIPRVWFFRHSRHGSILNGVLSYKTFCVSKYWCMENKRTKSKAAKMFSLLNTGDRAFLQWEASVRKNKTFKTFFWRWKHKANILCDSCPRLPLWIWCVPCCLVCTSVVMCNHETQWQENVLSWGPSYCRLSAGKWSVIIIHITIKTLLLLSAEN